MITMEGASGVNSSWNLGVDDHNLTFNGDQEDIGGQRTRQPDGGSERPNTRHSNPSRMKKEIEATRDAELLRIKKEYAEKLRHQNRLKVIIRQEERKVKKLKEQRDHGDWTADMEEQEVQVLEHLAELQDELDLLQGEIKFIEQTCKEEMTAIKSRAIAELEQVESDEEDGKPSDNDDRQTVQT